MIMMTMLIDMLQESDVLHDHKDDVICCESAKMLHFTATTTCVVRL
jgi:hypothetical protein